MKLLDGLILKEYAGKYVVIAVGDATKTFNGMIQLNETGAEIFKGIQNGCTKEEIIERLTQEFDVQKEQASLDVEEFTKSLQEANLLK